MCWLPIVIRSQLRQLPSTSTRVIEDLDSTLNVKHDSNVKPPLSENSFDAPVQSDHKRAAPGVGISSNAFVSRAGFSDYSNLQASLTSFFDCCIAASIILATEFDDTE